MSAITSTTPPRRSSATACATSASRRVQAQLIQRCATKLSEAIGRLEGFKDSRRQLTELRELEDEGDRLAREAISDLFNNGADAIALIRWKDIHEQLEEAIDACENAADVLEAILVKNR